VLLGRIRAFAERHHLWRPGTRVIVALSGGADSVSLLRLLRELHDAGDLVLDAAAHLHHGIRGAEADADEAFCFALCDQLSVELVTAHDDVPAAAARDGVSLEVAARRARHRFLEQVRSSRGADVVATAHTEDDQAETVLLRIVRGAGGRGLAGIRPRRAHLVRPLLQVTRQELRDELAARGQAWREDASNADLSNPRNRIRHELLPYLATHFNPSVSRALGRLAEVARGEETWLDEIVDRVSREAIQSAEGQVRLDVTRFADLPAGLARRLARRALETANPARSYAVRDVDRLLSVVAGRPVAAEISGLRAERFGETEVLLKRAVTRRARRRGANVRPEVGPKA
jgi:tRNA(Ile)-lysidine synthase